MAHGPQPENLGPAADQIRKISPFINEITNDLSLLHPPQILTTFTPSHILGLSVCFSEAMQ